MSDELGSRRGQRLVSWAVQPAQLRSGEPGGSRAEAPGEDPSDVWHDDPQVYRPDEVVQVAGFSVYGLSRALARTARLAGFYSEEGRILEVEVVHQVDAGQPAAAVRVTSGVENRYSQLPIAEAARFALARHLGDEKQAREAALDVIDVSVDGAGVRFFVARGNSGAWLALSSEGDLITVTGDEFDPHELELKTIRPESGYFSQ